MKPGRWWDLASVMIGAGGKSLSLSLPEACYVRKPLRLWLCAYSHGKLRTHCSWVILFCSHHLITIFEDLIVSAA